mgnify:CR=1 FL=1
MIIRPILFFWGWMGVQMNTPQYSICAAWLSRAYRCQKEPFTREQSSEHIRYSFFLGHDTNPLYQLHVMKKDALIIESTQCNNGKLYPSTVRTRIGYPIMLDADGETLQRWTGEAWSMEPTYAEFVFADLSLFRLFLNRNQVGILWERV